MKTNNKANESANKVNNAAKAAAREVTNQNATQARNDRDAMKTTAAEIKAQARGTIQEADKARKSLRGVLAWLTNDESEATTEIRNFLKLKKGANKEARRNAEAQILAMSTCRERVVYIDADGKESKTWRPCRIVKGEAKEIADYWTYIKGIFREYTNASAIAARTDRKAIADKLRTWRAQAMEAGTYSAKVRNAWLSFAKSAKTRPAIKFAPNVVIIDQREESQESQAS